MPDPTPEAGPPDDQAGRGRHMWRRFGVSALAVALVAGAAFAVAWHGTANDPETGGYPQRVGFERPSDRLPDRPGQLAATLYDNDFGSGRDLGVTATGRLYELPRGTNLLSASGALLLTQPGDRRHQLAVHDLSTGDRWVLDGAPSWREGVQPRAYWSQDGTEVLGSFTAAHRRGQHPAVLDVTSGAVTEIGTGTPAGFRSPSEPVTVHKVGGRSAAGGIVATTTDVNTGATSDLPLRLSGPWLGDPDAELVASVAPDGRTIVLVEDTDNRSSDTTVRMFSLADGTERTSRSVRDWDGCSPTWLGPDPVLPTTSQARGSGSSRWAGARLLTDDGATLLVAVHPRLQSTCLQLAAAALEAGPRWAFLGTATALWAWYPLPALIAASLLSLASLGLLRLFRTAHRKRAGRTGRGRDLRRRRAPVHPE